MKHKKNKPEQSPPFFKYNQFTQNKKEGNSIPPCPSLFFQLEQQPLKPTSLSQGQASAGPLFYS